MQKPAFSIYDASAGSGKTYTLVKEYLKIILTASKNDAYKNILAITFTNKAVHEMKSRVVENLSQFASEEPSEKSQQIMEDIKVETGLSREAIHSKAKNIIKSIIHNYAAFDISTIDKFTHKVIRAFAHDLNLPITFEVSLDTENLLTEAVDAIIAQAGNDEVLTQLLVDFTMEKTDDDKSWDVSRDIMETGKLILNENNREEIIHFNDKSITDFVAIKTKLTAECKELESQSKALANQALLLIQNKGLEFNSFYSSYVPKHFQKIANGALVKHVGHYKYLDASEGKRYSAKTLQNHKDLVDEIADELLRILIKINDIAERHSFYSAFLKNITPLSLLNTVSNELAKIQKDQNILSIAEFNKLINEQIQNQPAPFIYERLGEKYKHFFIDEFQDTSEMQWQNLIPLIDNALSSEDMQGVRGSLMIVGDPKQSIYRWRGGKAEQFIALSKDENPFANRDKGKFHLETNFRSYSQVIEFNNDFFKFLSGKFENEDYKDLYENHSEQKINNKKGGYVNVSFIPKTEIQNSQEDEIPEKTELYLLGVLDTIQKVKRNGFCNKDIVILIRKKAYGVEIAKYLTEQGIAVLSSESLLITSSGEVQFIIHLLEYLHNKNNLEAKAHFLYYLGKNEASVHDFIAAGMQRNSENEFQQWLSEFDFDISFENIRKKSLYEATELIISKGINNENRNAYVQYFLDIVLERDVKNQAGIADFLNYWNKNKHKLSVPSPEGNDAIRIMTIHASKGLEFPVVIFPFAEEDYSKGPKEKMWLNSEENIMGVSKVLVDKSKKVEDFGEDALMLYSQKTQEDLLDDINVLYVALTRAEEQLYVISHMLEPNKQGDYPNNMASFFIEFLIDKSLFDNSKTEYEFGSFQKLSKEHKKTNKHLLIPQVTVNFNPKNIKIAQRESLMWNTHQQKAIEYGNIIHEILSYVKTKTDLDIAITKAIENGLIAVKNKDVIENTISDIVNHPELKLFFDTENKVLNEKAIIQIDGNMVKPDRMVVTENNEIYLLDYKTGTHQSKYQKQLENYQNVIEKMGYKVAKKTLVYIGEQLEIVHL